MTGTMRAPRTRGLLSGALLVLLGLWGALLPFVGPYAHFGFAPDEPWVYTAARLQLSVLPGIATVIGGLVLLVSANRAAAMFGAWLAALAGAWFVVGHTLGALWGLGTAGAPLGTSTAQRVTEQIAGFSGLGVVTVFLSAFALGRFAVVGVRETRRAAKTAAAREAARGAPARPGAGPAQPAVPPRGRYGRTSGTGPPPSPGGAPPAYGPPGQQAPRPGAPGRSTPGSGTPGPGAPGPEGAGPAPAERHDERVAGERRDRPHP
ncbi:hypothetical protein Acsp04_09650 [Actinomadura sp. NBRC 104425]|uniref:hypothetical protein n=1 Tax=Actinomadura sp. NBRC 104425 TaxID=3032204 RepID=UPI0024A547E3|nr:hypothetical protein [Actinomadura sp. NBRC 104425]GLZ10730.1 hypothetical protein Acsp04_09650 [Actinomadura sp. NBRC 104425]